MTSRNYYLKKLNSNDFFSEFQMRKRVLQHCTLERRQWFTFFLKIIRVLMLSRLSSTFSPTLRESLSVVKCCEVFKAFWKYDKHLEIMQSIKKLSETFKKCAVHLESVQNTEKLSKTFRKCAKHWEMKMNITANKSLKIQYLDIVCGS